MRLKALGEAIKEDWNWGRLARDAAICAGAAEGWRYVLDQALSNTAQCNNECAFLFTPIALATAIASVAGPFKLKDTLSDILRDAWWIEKEATTKTMKKIRREQVGEIEVKG